MPMSAAFHEELSRTLEASSSTAASAAWDHLQAVLDRSNPDWTATFRTVCRATHAVHLPWTITIDTPTNGRLYPMNGHYGTTSASPPLRPTSRPASTPRAGMPPQTPVAPSSSILPLVTAPPHAIRLLLLSPHPVPSARSPASARIPGSEPAACGCW